MDPDRFSWILISLFAWWLGAAGAGVRRDLLALDQDESEGEDYSVLSLLRRLRDDPVALGLRLRVSRLTAAALVPLGLLGALGGADWQGVLFAVLAGALLVAVAETAAGSRALRPVARLTRGGAGYGLWVRLTLPVTRLGRPLVRLRSRPVEEGDRAMVLTETRVTLANAGGRLGFEERRILRRLLASSAIQVGDIMTPWSRVDRLEASTPVSEALGRVKASLHSRHPVVEGDRVVGLITVKDLLTRVHDAEAAEQPISTLLRPVYFERRDATLRALLDDLREAGVHLAVVLDRFGEPCGLVTIEDILEEIVGELHDERERAGEEAP